MKKFDDSRKRSFMIVAATIFIGASLGYMYSSSKSNHMLTVKHDAMELNYVTCSRDLEKCSADLDECSKTSENLKGLKNDKEIELQAETSKIQELRREYEETENQLASFKKSFSDIGLLLGLFDDSELEKDVSKEKADLIIDKINALKKDKMEFDELTTKYNSLLEEVKKISAEKEAFSQKLQDEQNAKSLVQEELENLKQDNAVKMEQAKSDLTTKVDEPKKSEDVNVASPPVTNNPAPEKDAVAAVADNAAALPNTAPADQSNQGEETKTTGSDNPYEQNLPTGETLKVETDAYPQ